jgi:hypothetical protein
MLRLYFGDIYSIAATVLILGLLAFILFSWRDRDGVTRWGRRLTIFILAGTVVSMCAAMRDNYATADALFAMDSLPSNLCSIAGGAIFLLGLLAIFLKRRNARKTIFFLAAALFTAQVVVIETARLSAWMGGTL